MATPTLTQERLKQLLAYDPETGVFNWRVNRRPTIRIGDVAGCTRDGYAIIKIDQCIYMAHRLAWLYVHGCWPTQDIDHINRVRSDNRLANLRECSRAENCQNTAARFGNTSGHKGVSWVAKRQKWLAQIVIGGKNVNLGRYTTLEDAIAARRAAELDHYTHAPRV